MICHPLQQALLLWLVFASLPTQSAAAEVNPRARAEQLYRVKRWSVEDGLPQGSVKALAQTSRGGYLWIGTLNGLARFDGMRFKVFDHRSTPAMTHDSVNDLVEDTKDGSLWIGTGSGLLRYFDHKFVRYGSEHGIVAGVGVLAASRLGGVWFVPRKGQVSLIRDGHIRTWEIGSYAKEDPRQITEEDDSHLLIFPDVLGRLDLRTGLVSRVEVPGKIPSCDRYLLNSDQTLWVGNSEGLWRGAGTNWIRTAWPKPNLLAGGCYQTANERLWITAKDMQDSRRPSLHCLIDGELEAFKPDDLLDEIDVTRLIEDREGNLWLGTTTALFRLQPHRLKVYARRNGLKNEDVRAVTTALDGTVWLGTTTGLSTIREGHIVNVSPPVNEGWAQDWGNIRSFLTDAQSRLLVNYSSAEVMMLDGDQWSRVQTPANLGKLGAISLYQDREGQIWIGTRHGVL